jgi:diguanylate cyclase (GGDEF)-like protein
VRAVNDRKVAAEDRAQAAKDREDSGTDELTAVRRREAGLAARDRDVAAGLRDQEAEARDDAAGDLDRTAGDRAASNRQRAEDAGARAASERAGAADSRVRAVNDRKVAADDRAQGSRDRQVAAEDRAQAARDRENSGTDELTGVSRRGAGLAAIVREINRAQRDSGELVAAYVDVDGLKATNDSKGHAAGDALLIAVADSLRACLRSYDVITRVGGDEFVCALPGIAVDHARRRFGVVSEMLAAGGSGASITVGLARLQTGDSADDLIERADDEVSIARKRR